MRYTVSRAVGDEKGFVKWQKLEVNSKEKAMKIVTLWLREDFTASIKVRRE